MGVAAEGHIDAVSGIAEGLLRLGWRSKGRRRGGLVLVVNIVRLLLVLLLVLLLHVLLSMVALEAKVRYELVVAGVDEGGCCYGHDDGVAVVAAVAAVVVAACFVCALSSLLLCDL